MRIQAYFRKHCLSLDLRQCFPSMPAADCSSILKALADRTRMRLVKRLLTHDLTVNELTDLLDLSQYNTSKHLRVLKEAGIVDARAEGQRRQYFIAPTLRKRLQREGPVLDFGCCSFQFDQLPD